MTLVSAVLPGCEMSDNTTSSQRGWAQSLLITGIQELWSFGECSALIYGHFLPLSRPGELCVCWWVWRKSLPFSHFIAVI